MNRQLLFVCLFTGSLAAGFGWTPARAADFDNDTCLACHGQKESGAPFVNLTAFQHSAHAKNLCMSCHTDITEIPHPTKLAPVSCNRCHRVESQIYLQSDHGRAVARGQTEAASCKDCHGHSHTILNSRDVKSPVNRRNIPATCSRCHDDPQRMSKVRLNEPHAFKSYSLTVHGQAFAQGRLTAAVCSDCHGSHDLHRALNPLSRVNRKNIPETCGRCHQNVFGVYRLSIHGQAAQAGIKDAPVCTDCHGEHTIRSPKDPASSVWAGAVTKTCSGCHESKILSIKFGLPVDRLKSYLDTYHGLAYQRGDIRVANCASCHGYHDVLPATDPRSSVSKANLATTCGKCHPGSAVRLMQGAMHGGPSANHWVVEVAKHFYWILIPLVLGFMLFHNVLDLIWKMIDPPAPITDDEKAPVRLTPNERWQHGVLILTFTILAYTGFALKFHDLGLMQLLAPFGEEVRRGIHRWTAVLFCLLGVYHFLYMLGTRRGRFLLKAFMPKPGDLRAMLQHLGYRLGLRRTPPTENHDFYHYAEKMEYWSLIWGSLVMVMTGGLLVFNNFALKHFPVWVSDLATLVHYYEAVLACLAILIWHGYMVIFDPRVYPMSWAWLIGRHRPRRRKKSSGSEDPPSPDTKA